MLEELQDLVGQIDYANGEPPSICVPKSSNVFDRMATQFKSDVVLSIEKGA
jgi:hypothetical protein